jgi:predicted ATP-dependent serine protease
MERKTKAVIVLFLGLTIVNVSLTVHLQGKLNNAERDIEQLNNNQSDIQRAVTQISLGNATIENGGTASSVTSQEFFVPAYDSATGQGVVVRGSTTPLLTDEVFLDTSETAYTTTMQMSFTRAITKVGSLTEYNVSEGVAIEFETPDAWERIGGGSASLALATAYAATDPEYRVNHSVITTGVVRSDGTIGRVGDIRTKAVSAESEGYETLLVPLGQGVRVQGIEVIEVQSLSEALNYSLRPTA